VSKITGQPDWVNYRKYFPKADGNMGLDVHIAEAARWQIRAQIPAMTRTYCARSGWWKRHSNGRHLTRDRLQLAALTNTPAGLVFLPNPVKRHEPGFIAQFRKIRIHQITKASHDGILWLCGLKRMTLRTGTALVDKPCLRYRSS
jgi:hypothetical protein